MPKEKRRRKKGKESCRQEHHHWAVTDREERLEWQSGHYCDSMKAVVQRCHWAPLQRQMALAFPRVYSAEQRSQQCNMAAESTAGGTWSSSHYACEDKHRMMFIFMGWQTVIPCCATLCRDEIGLDYRMPNITGHFTSGTTFQSQATVFLFCSL